VFMTEFNDPGTILDIPAGTSLNFEESSAVEDILGNFVEEASSDRDGTVLSQEDCAAHIGEILKSNGDEVSFNVQAASLGLQSLKESFDIVGTVNDSPAIVEVVSQVSNSHLETVKLKMDLLQQSAVAHKVFLGVDVITGGELLSGGISRALKSLMEERGLGVILTDTTFALICQNFDQLLLEEMPDLLYRRA